MEFIDEMKLFASKVDSKRQSAATEEATKMSLIVPFFSILGYDVFNTDEFCPEYTADVGIKKGEKVDYAILDNGNPTVLIECKWCGETLDKHGSQLFRYFSTTTAKFGILTNGISYRFFTDLEEANKMDLVPFLEIDMLNLKDSALNELKKFCKANFDSDKIFSTAEELKYTNLIKQAIMQEMDNPSDNFTRYILTDIYDGQKTQKVTDKFKPIIKRSFSSLINELVNQKITTALYSGEEAAATLEIPSEEMVEEESKIVTSQDEIEAFYIIRGLLVGVTPIEDIVYRDAESYFSILYQNNNRKPICRLNLVKKNKAIYIPDDTKKFVKFPLSGLNDLYLCKQQIIDALQRYVQ